MKKFEVFLLVFYVFMIYFDEVVILLEDCGLFKEVIDFLDWIFFLYVFFSNNRRYFEGI